MKERNRNTGDEALLKSVGDLARRLNALNQDAFCAYAPVVEAIVNSGSRDIPQIEHTLDGMLSFCGYDPILQLYRRLCRHYWDIDPIATTWHVNAYREMWDSAEPDAQSKAVRERVDSSPVRKRSPKNSSKLAKIRR